jgi:predicted CoA-binding protein
MSLGGWSCPHFVDNICEIIKKECDPGDKGCILYGKFTFGDLNSPSTQKVMKKDLKMNCEFPNLNETNEDVKEIFAQTKTIAIVGLSPNEEKDSNKVARYLQNASFKIIPIYPKEDTILGEKVYRSLDEVQEKIDMVDMFRKPEVANTLVEQISKRDDVKCLWLQLGIVNNEAAQKAKDLGLKVVQNKCTKIEHKKLEDRV